MAAESIGAGLAMVPPSSPCPKCGIRPRRLNGTYCRECTREWFQARRLRQQKNRSSLCRKCGATKKTGVSECTRCAINRAARYGEQRVREQFVGFADVLIAALSEPECIRVFANFYKNRTARFPPPSKLFPGLDARLDARLIRDHRNKDVALGQALAAIPANDQRDFLELYLVDPADAHHWAALPAWKRPIRKGDADDQQIWKFFTMQRLNMEQAASPVAPAWAMSSQGAQLPQMFGVIAYLSPAGLKKLCLVMSMYGTALQHDQALGNVTKKPWEERP
jgi:hypothetical protein